MTDCRHAREWMSAALDEALGPREQAELRAHLDGCPACQAYERELREAHRQVRSLEPVEPPPWLTAQIMARVRAEGRPNPSLWRRFLRPLVMRPELQVATLLLLATTGYYLARARKAQGLAGPPPQPESKSLATPASPPPAAAPSRAREAPPAPPLERRELQTQSGFASPAPADSAKPQDQLQEKEKRDSQPGYLADVSAAGPAKAAPAPPPALEQKKSEVPVMAEASGTVQGALGGERSAKQARAQAKDKAPAGAARSEVEHGYAAPPLVIRWVPPEGAGGSAVRPLLEEEAAAVGATVVEPQGRRMERQLALRLEARRLPELVQRLKRIGRVVEAPSTREDAVEPVVVLLRW